MADEQPTGKRRLRLVPAEETYRAEQEADLAATQKAGAADVGLHRRRLLERRAAP